MTARRRPDDVAVRVQVTGRVQGVFFRQSTARRAEESGVTGWIRNLPDGGVEAWLQGRHDSVEQVVDWMRAGGPPGAQVDAVDALEATPDPGCERFEVRR